ncbi:MAG: insulinase family protein [Muribaculaceae bacterium]|nr:insulinase family protein [Muribaculaceae bacterium]
MKKFFKSGLMMLLSIFAAGNVMAQMPELPQVPVDEAVIVGKLDNGLTYYIRHNETPKGQADFYIAQKVGSVLEEDNQRGLAHFLEHMCFNGTKNFPGNQLIDWLESVGVKFGQNLNAYTSVDETVYNISSVPVARESVQDSCLLILHDWANDLLLDTDEINKERGVIHEEWRRSMQGQMRIFEEILPTIYPGSRYGYRLPIGTMEVVDNFDPDVLRAYYHKWYRPDQQGIVVVGDIDPVRIEAKIKEIFGGIKMPENAAERVYFDVEDNEGTIYAIGKDKEMPYGVFLFFFKSDKLPVEMRNTPLFYQMNYMTEMISSMLNARLNEAGNKPDAEFAGARADYDDFFVSKTKDAFSIEGSTKGNDILPALEQVYRELLRAQRGGFTPGEYERAKAEFLSQLEKKLSNKNKTENDTYSNEIVRSFIDGTPLAGIEADYQVYSQMANMIPVDLLNQLLPELISADNRVFAALLPDNDTFKVPTEEEVAAVIAKVDAEEIEPYKDEMKSEPLIPNLPAPGKITATKQLEQWGATEFTLSNGVKVIVKPTDFNDNEIIFTALARNGNNVLDPAKAASVKFLPYAISNYGLGDYTNIDMQKYLQGRQVTVQPSVEDYYRTIEGKTTVKDLPVMMEMIYMTFVDFNITPDDYAAIQSSILGILGNQEAQPQYIFSKLATADMYASPLKQVIGSDDIKNAKREEILEILHNFTANAADYTFIFTGKIDMDQFKPLLEQYIATLPADVAKANSAIPAAVASLEPTKGSASNEHTTAMQTPQTWVFVGVNGHENYTARNRTVARMASQILSNRLLKKVREEMGATYSIGAYGQLLRVNDNNIMIQVPFPTKPEVKDEVIAVVKEKFQSMADQVNDDELNPIKEFMIKEATEGREKNEDWNSAITGYLINNVDTFNGIDDVINSITTADIQAFMKDLLNQGNYRVVILNPEN